MADKGRGSPVLETPFHPCLHAESDRAPTARTCIYGYECWHCGFDQWLDEAEKRQNAHASLNVTRTVLAKVA